jgi:type IV pilus assembly protein PilC
MEFSYKAKSRDGALKQGIITANNEEEVAASLQKQGLFVLNITGEKKGGFHISFKKKINLKDKIIFTRQLAIMIQGGLPLVSAIQALQEQTENKVFIKAISEIRVDVRGGMSLSKALAKHKDIFPDFYIAVITSGEKSGKLDKVLVTLADQLQKDYDLMSKVKAAVTYPIVIVFALVLMLILMLVFVVPKLKVIFDQMGASLPLPTRVLLGTSSFMVNYWYVVIILLVLIYFAAKKWGRTNYGGLFIDKFKIKVPIFGVLVRKIYLARFSRTTATLVSSGLPMLEIIATDKRVIDNQYFDPIFDALKTDIESGVALSVALRKHKDFPVMISQMVSVGEKSGKIDEILLQLADFYDKEVEVMTSQLASLIEPLLILIIGGGIGLAIASVILPIYSLVNVI